MNIRNTATCVVTAAAATAAAMGGMSNGSLRRATNYTQLHDYEDLTGIAPSQPHSGPIVHSAQFLQGNGARQLTGECESGISNIVNSLSGTSKETAAGRYAQYVQTNCNLNANQAQSVYTLLLNQFETYGVSNTINQYRNELINTVFVSTMANASQGQSFADVVQSFNGTEAAPGNNGSNASTTGTPPADDQAAPVSNGTNGTEAADGNNASNASNASASPANDQAADGNNASNASNASASPADDQADDGNNASNASAPPANDQADDGNNASNASAPPAPGPNGTEAELGNNGSNASTTGAPPAPGPNGTEAELGNNGSNASTTPGSTTTGLAATSPRPTFWSKLLSGFTGNTAERAEI